MRMSPIDQPLMPMELLGRRSLIGGLVKHPVPRCALRRTDQNGKVAATSERRISRVSGSMGEGSKPMWR